jgi:hypothetical protein
VDAVDTLANLAGFDLESAGDENEKPAEPAKNVTEQSEGNNDGSTTMKMPA